MKLRLFLSVLLFQAVLTARSQISLPRLISDGMVLQRDEPLKIWGNASPNERIEITFENKKRKIRADQDGKWSFNMEPHAAGGPYEMILKGKNEILLKDILFGDVWFCSGQSNMVHQMQHHDVTYADDIAHANNSQIRQFLVPTLTSLTGPQADYPQNTGWKVCTPQNVREFSVAAYYFALKINATQHVPVGIINASVGGTPIEAWTSENGFQDFEDIQTRIAKNKDPEFLNSLNRPRSFSQPKVTDKGLLASPKWFETTYKPQNWKTINIPGYWEDQGIKDLNGVVWYRKEIEIPASMAGKEAKVFLGRIVDADELYINGQKVGNTGYQYPQRRYNVPAGLLKSGKNLFVVRVTNDSGKGGFVPDKPYCVFAGADTVDLKGTWVYKVGDVFIPRTGAFGGGGFSAQNQPAALFNAMVAPALNYPVKGVLWYQGESNAGMPFEYEKLQKAQILDWRNQWKKADLPFLYVQLPNFMDANYLPSESSWAQLRESQRKALAVPNTAMAVAIDLGEWNDIHPDNKKDVGERLAEAARKLVYKENIVGSGPMFESVKRQNNKLILTFSGIGSGLQSKDGESLREFAVAGSDKKYVWAEARINGNTIEVWNDEVDDPLYVRYAWADNPDVNFYNLEGFPASPFEATVNPENANNLWQGKKAAVVLTYDDALDVHLDNAVPVLNSLGLKGTFYLSAGFPGSKNRINDWRRAARNGHELGNHTMFHPCDASKPGRSWVQPQDDLSKYSTADIVREVEMTNTFLELLDGKKERTFAYTCGDMTTGEGSFVDAIKDQFIALRGITGKLNTQDKMDYTNINCYVVDNSNADQLIKWAEEAKKNNALLVVLFHGVGGGHNINTDLDKHNAFLNYLKENQSDYWVTTMLEAARNSMQNK
jgi:sialate O-acetylesterase